MSQEAVEVVRAAFRAFEGGQVDELLELMSDGMTTHRLEPDNAVYHGKEGFLQATADWIEGFEDWTVTPEEFAEVGDSVVVRVHQSARGESSGVAVENHSWFVFDVSGGKVARMSIHLSEAEAVAAANG